MTPTEQLLRDALETGLAAAEEIAVNTRVSLAGYLPHKHTSADADVAEIKAAIAMLDATSQQAEGEPALEAFRDWANSNLTDGHGYAAKATWDASRAAFFREFPKGIDAAESAALAALKQPTAAPLPAQPQGQGAVAYISPHGGEPVSAAYRNETKSRQAAYSIALAPIEASPPSQAPEPAQQEAAGAKGASDD